MSTRLNYSVPIFRFRNCCTTLVCKKNVYSPKQKMSNSRFWVITVCYYLFLLGSGQSLNMSTAFFLFNDKEGALEWGVQVRPRPFPEITRDGRKKWSENKLQRCHSCPTLVSRYAVCIVHLIFVRPHILH